MILRSRRNKTPCCDTIHQLNGTQRRAHTFTYIPMIREIWSTLQTPSTYIYIHCALVNKLSWAFCLRQISYNHTQTHRFIEEMNKEFAKILKWTRRENLSFPQLFGLHPIFVCEIFFSRYFLSLVMLKLVFLLPLLRLLSLMPQLIMLCICILFDMANVCKYLKFSFRLNVVGCLVNERL